MTTYREAAGFAFERVLELTGDYSLLANANNGYWHMANTLDTCLQYLGVCRKGNNLDQYKLVENALNKVFDARMQSNKKPVPPGDWGKWSRYEGGPWSDDYGWWGIALTRALRLATRLGYDENLQERILAYARNSFAAFSYAWDNSEAVSGSNIFGGAWNHEQKPELQAMNGRNSVTNEVLWIFAHDLNQIEAKAEYQNQIRESEKFFFEARAKKANENGALLNSDGLVRERLLGMGNGYPEWIWVGDQGLFIGACLTETGQGPNQNIALIHAKAVTAKMLDSDTPEGVLHDNIAPNSDFNDDYATGKGAFMRMWTRFQGLSSQSQPSNYDALILANANGVWNNRPTPSASGLAQYQIGFNWNPEGKPKSKGGEPTYPNGDDNPSVFSMLVCQVAGLAALTAACLVNADKEIPAKATALIG